MGPTLFEVVAIAGLHPDGEVLHHCSMPQKVFNVLKGSPTSFGSFIKYHNRKEGKVSHEEYVTFLLLWLLAFCMCYKSVQVFKGYLLLANLLHEGKQFAFN